jgi:type I restriction enzyme S subunit
MKKYNNYRNTNVNWVQEIPEHWNFYPNIAIFDERIEKGYSNLELLSVTIGRGIIRQSDNETKKDISNDDKSNYKRVCIGDIAYNRMRMWQGAVGHSEYEGIVSPAYVVLNPKIELNSKYFHYLFRIPAYISESYRNGYGICDDQHSLRYTQFKRMYSILPPIEEQNIIVRYLDYKITSVNKLMKLGQTIIGRTFKNAGLLQDYNYRLITDAVSGAIDLRDFDFSNIKINEVEMLGELAFNENEE